MAACKKVTFKKPRRVTVERCSDRRLATSATARFKRDGACRADGKFARCDTEDHEPASLKRKREKSERAEARAAQAAARPRGLCFKTKAEMLAVFADANRHVLEPCESDRTGQSFDPVNHRLDLKRKVTTCDQAVRVASPTSGPYCLDMIDIKLLNQLEAAKAHGGFRLPPKAQEIITEREAREHYGRGLEGLRRRKR